MNRVEILETRCLLAKIVNVPPDNVEVVSFENNCVNPMFIVPYEKQWEFGISFEKKPTSVEILKVLDEFIGTGKEWLEEDGYFFDEEDIL